MQRFVNFFDQPFQQKYKNQIINRCDKIIGKYKGLKIVDKIIELINVVASDKNAKKMLLLHLKRPDIFQSLFKSKDQFEHFSKQLHSNLWRKLLLTRPENFNYVIFELGCFVKPEIFTFSQYCSKEAVIANIDNNFLCKLFPTENDLDKFGNYSLYNDIFDLIHEN